MSLHDARYLAIEHRGEFLLVFRGHHRLGETAAERTINYWPRVVCVCAERHTAKAIADWLEGQLPPDT